MTEQDVKQGQELNEDQLDSVSGGLSGRHEEEFFEGLGNKGLSERHSEEFHEGLGNKGLSERHSEEFHEGLGNK